MAVTAFQATVLRLLAEQRRHRGESYVAGGVALDALLGGHRRSRDFDPFHATDEVLRGTWALDRKALGDAGSGLYIVREAPTFVEAASW
jgi:hypothetical protein